MRVHGIEGRSLADIEQETAAGGRFVFFEYCISFIFLTLRRPSVVYFIPAGRKTLARGACYSLISLSVGWWGVPWGLVYTPLTVITNLSGGCDVTGEVLAELRQRAGETAAVLSQSPAVS
jgi:hypothetical protein